METLESLANAVLELNRNEVVRLSELALAEGFPAEQAISEGLAAGMRLVGERFTKKIYFVPEVLVAGRTLYAGMEILGPRVTRRDEGRGTAVLAVVKGDFHDIGKNIVKLMLDAAGVRIVDLGKNVGVERILEAVEAEHADIVGISTLMTTTLDVMADHVATIKANTGAAVLVGGAPVTKAFAKRIGADGTAPDAAGAVELALSLIVGAAS